MKSKQMENKSLLYPFTHSKKRRFDLHFFFFYKQWVYKHTEPQITDFLSISLSIFPASDLPMGKVLSQDFVYFVSEIEPGYDFFLSFVSSLLQMLEELIKIGN